VAIFFLVAIAGAVALALVVRIPAFESRRVRLVTLLVIAGVIAFGVVAGSIWALATIDDAVREREAALARVLPRYTAHPLRLFEVRDLPGDTTVDARYPDLRSVRVRSDVSRWWVRRCVQAQVSRAGVSIRTTNGGCH
jgi:hypothetical protein